MPGGNKRTNFFLLLISILICFGCGYFFRQSTADPSGLRNGTIELLAVDDSGEKAVQEEKKDEELQNSK